MHRHKTGHTDYFSVMQNANRLGLAFFPWLSRLYFGGQSRNRTTDTRIFKAATTNFLHFNTEPKNPTPVERYPFLEIVHFAAQVRLLLISTL